MMTLRTLTISTAAAALLVVTPALAQDTAPQLSTAEGTLDAQVELPLTQDIRDTSNAWLQRVTYDFIALQHNVHQAHWNVSGIEFYQLHEFYGELYDILQGYIDASAERKLHLGASADGRLQPSADSSDIPAIASGFVGDTTSLRFLSENYSVMSRVLYDAIEATSDDPVTQDLLIGFTHEIDKGFWQLRQHLQSTDSLADLPAGTATGNGNALTDGTGGGAATESGDGTGGSGN